MLFVDDRKVRLVSITAVSFDYSIFSFALAVMIAKYFMKLEL